MKIINIYPLLNTERIYKQDMNMALTHLVQKYPAYATAFCNCKGFKILDNSIIEADKAVNMEELIAAAYLIKASEIILPDTLDNMVATLNQADESLTYLSNQTLLKEFRIMAVCQGNDAKQVRECFKHLDAIPEIHTIGIPKRLCKKDERGRVGFEDMWLGSSKEIHLLGCGESFTEILEYRYPDRIRSCDTCLASLLAKNGLHKFTRRQFTTTLDLVNDYVTPEQYATYYEAFKDSWRPYGI